MRDLVHGAAQAGDFRNVGEDAPGHVHQHEWISVDIGLARNLPRLLSGNAFGLRPCTRRRELKGDGSDDPSNAGASVCHVGFRSAGRLPLVWL